MQTIYKFQITLNDKTTVRVPKNAKLLSAQVQHGIPCVWVMLNTDEEKVDRHLYLATTGNPMPYLKYDEWIFVDTFMMYDGALVVHLFEVQ